MGIGLHPSQQAAWWRSTMQSARVLRVGHTIARFPWIGTAGDTAPRNVYTTVKGMGLQVTEETKRCSSVDSGCIFLGPNES
jgi:hypothetical protein